MSESAERKEAPTPKRAAKLRAQGRWPHSSAASAWFGILALAVPVLLVGTFASAWTQMLHAASRVAGTLASSSHPDATMARWLGAWLLWRNGWQLIGLTAVAAIAAAIGSASSSGALGFSPTALLP
ncbi:MAG: EscU/YscU/HrcU family type III secretion system export apparatus switch protein, partial [Candidatus Eremiobacteraeota bacterium]|nr:EscU/YscU/HrcU family type III secretion system export apparatus switch protein [Candidatus Eremiobacteraeota bacterium]MBV8281487.1 EscU/YscU/HrcU family type III secretion system export apparatus switch protein [Candidatus Eremiobacteraeota bacterium]